jgi:hypothetical protein
MQAVPFFIHPGAHTGHRTLPMMLHLPSGHSAHCAAPLEGAKVPFGQARQLVEPDEYEAPGT